ncbi:MAG: homocysteine methyltransferase [Clostridiales bacterium]|nr:homocysteine methyltransferase [Clostridiales bacterium]
MKVTDFLKDNILRFDGGMGTLLQAKGLVAGELPEYWNITHSDIITQIHRDYFNAGSNVVSANTFGANILKFTEDELDAVINAAVRNARCARDTSPALQPKWIALDVGPTGKMLAPYGELGFEDAVEIFSKTIRTGVKYGVDLIIIETMNDCYETKAALLAAKECCDLPVFVSNAYTEDKKLLSGTSPQAMIAMLEGMGADAIGINCSFGPKSLGEIAREYVKYASVPVLFQPNAGMPRVENGRTVFDISPNEFAREVNKVILSGVRIVGGCCGTTPEHISALTKASANVSPVPVTDKNITWVSSYTHTVDFSCGPILIGERINPTGKKKFKEALKQNDINYILNEGISQQEKGVHILDVNVGLPDIDEREMLKTTVCRLQEVTNLPLQIDTSDYNAMELSLRYYNGKAMINSVNGKKESMDMVFPLAKKYGGLIVALTLDENGIPQTARGRIEIAKRILDEAQKYGISKKDIIFDPLTMAISTDKDAARITLEAVSAIKNELQCHTSLGVSNVSFGLPQRDIINSNFFTLAMCNGLSAAIMNPYSYDMMEAYHAFNTLTGMDDNCSDYISFVQSYEKITPVTQASPVSSQGAQNSASELQSAIIKGLKERARDITANLLQNIPPMEIIQNEIIPAMDTVGDTFDKKTTFLPQLLMSAEAAKYAFDKIKEHSASNNTNKKCPFVIATVQGDIHDIGKNIVKLLLENYGFDVIDLGRDVAVDTVADAVVASHAPILGLSVLMTTTLPAMERTIEAVRKVAPRCKIVVGGAVLTEEYALSIGADKYARDALDTVRYADEVNNSFTK